MRSTFEMLDAEFAFEEESLLDLWLDYVEAILAQGGELAEGVDDPGIFKAVFLAGGPGAGKSTIAVAAGAASAIGGDPEGKKKAFPTKAGPSKAVRKVVRQIPSGLGLKPVNSDAALEHMLRRAGKTLDFDSEVSPQDVKDRDATRAMAKTLTGKRQKFYLDQKLGIVIDGTGHDYQKIVKRVSALRNLGYDCSMIFVNTKLETSLRRNKMRDRVVPEAIVKERWQAVQQNLGRFQSLFGSNAFFVIDNDVDNMADGIKKVAIAKIQKAVMLFAKRPVKNPKALAWIKAARAAKART